MVILPGDITEREALKGLAAIKEHITANTGVVVDELVWGKRDLAYRIKKQDTGFYGIMHFTMSDVSKLAEIKNELRFDQLLLRYLLIKIDEKYTLADFAEDCKKAERMKAEALAKRVKKSSKRDDPKADAKEEKVVKKKSSSDEVLSDPELSI